MMRHVGHRSAVWSDDQPQLVRREPGRMTPTTHIVIVFSVLSVLVSISEACNSLVSSSEKADTDEEEAVNNPFREHLEKKFKRKKQFAPPGPKDVVYGFKPVNTILSSFLDQPLQQPLQQPLAEKKSFVDHVPGI